MPHALTLHDDLPIAGHISADASAGRETVVAGSTRIDLAAAQGICVGAVAGLLCWAGIVALLVRLVG